MDTHWIFMALASLGRLGQRGILGQSSILDNLQGRLGQCGSGWTGAGSANQWIPIGYNVGSCLQGGLGQSANPWVPTGYPWRLAVDWDHGYPSDIDGIGIPG